MNAITVPCQTCSGTGWATHEDRHTETRQDQCRACGGTGSVPARPGESRETSWPWAVPGAEPTADLWCCHVVGPDDVYAAPDLMTAVRWSRMMNEVAVHAEDRMAKRLGRPLTDEDWVLCFANVERWPWSAEAHARAMPDAIKQMSPRGPKPAEDGSRGGEALGRDDQTARFIAESEALEREEALRLENRRLRIAFHDATRRPMGVIPDSGLEFYDPRMADEAEARRANGGRP